MADPADRAAIEMEHHHAMAMKRRAPAGPKATGFCLVCGDDEIPSGARHCGDERCADIFNRKKGEHDCRRSI